MSTAQYDYQSIFGSTIQAHVIGQGIGLFAGVPKADQAAVPRFKRSSAGHFPAYPETGGNFPGFPSEKEICSQAFQFLLAKRDPGISLTGQGNVMQSKQIRVGVNGQPPAPAQKSTHPASVVTMTVAQNKSVKRAQIYPQEIGISHHLPMHTGVKKDFFSGTFHHHGQSPLPDQADGSGRIFTEDGNFYHQFSPFSNNRFLYRSLFLDLFHRHVCTTLRS